MSSMLDQAIVDAKALKEAAIKSAESSIIEKYSNEIREAVDTMLNQEEVINEEEERRMKYLESVLKHQLQETKRDRDIIGWMMIGGMVLIPVALAFQE